MIQIRKLLSLPVATRRRKLVQILALWENRLKNENELVDFEAFAAMAEIARTEVGGVGIRAEVESNVFGSQARGDLVRSVWKLRQRLLDALGIDQADWDFQNPLDRSHAAASRFPYSVWLEDVRSPFNVGSIVRTAEAYGFRSVFLTSGSPSIEHARVRRSSMESWNKIEVSVRSLDELVETWTGAVFALELGGTPVHEYAFPPAEGGPALILVGSEELGLSREALAWADRHQGRVALPLFGEKSSLNVSVAFGAVCSWWTA